MSSNTEIIKTVMSGGFESMAAEAALPNGSFLSDEQRGAPAPYSDVDSASAAIERRIDENDLLPVSFLEQGAIRQRSVARVFLRQPHGGLPAGNGWGTGFLIGKDILMTNNHVVKEGAFLEKVGFQFNFQFNLNTFSINSEHFIAVADGLMHTNIDLDYSIIRLAPGPVGPAQPVHAGERWGHISLEPFVEYRSKQHFNIVQHPSGRAKEVSLQDNEIDGLFSNVVKYKGDTEPGSSGSPVFNNLWQLVALHHAGGDRDANGNWLNNEGIRIDRIVADLKATFADSPSTLTELGLT